MIFCYIFFVYIYIFGGVPYFQLLITQNRYFDIFIEQNHGSVEHSKNTMERISGNS